MSDKFQQFLIQQSPQQRKRQIIAARKKFRTAPYHADAVHNDATARLTIASLTCTDNEFNSFSLWLKTATNQTGKTFWVTDPNGDSSPTAYYSAGTVVEFFLSDNGQNNTLVAHTGSVPNGVWHHLLGTARTNLATGSKIVKLYLDDVDVTADILDTDSSFSIAMNGRELVVLGDGFGGITGDFADLWLAPGQSLLTGSDISEATRRKFISATGKPVYLGGNGEVPTGVAPSVFFSGDSAAFPTNRGTGGAFTLTGSFTNASTSPSD